MPDSVDSLKASVEYALGEPGWPWKDEGTRIVARALLDALDGYDATIAELVVALRERVAINRQMEFMHAWDGPDDDHEMEWRALMVRDTEQYHAEIALLARIGFSEADA